MPKPTKPTPFSQLVKQMPLHLSMDDVDNADTLIRHLQQRVNSYTSQNMALYLRKFVRELPAPSSYQPSTHWPACYNGPMPKPTKPTPFSQLVEQMPLHLSMDDVDNADTLIGHLQQRVNSYTFQNMALYLRKFVRELPEPGYGFDLSIDQEDGTYFLYTSDVYGVKVDEDFFPDNDALNDFRSNQVRRLEGFAQQINDSPWRETSDFFALVHALNKVDWRKEDMDAVIANTMERQGYDGRAFIAALHAHEIEAATPKAAKASGRRPGL